MNITKRRTNDEFDMEDCEFDITLTAIEAIKLVVLDDNALMLFRAALLKSMDGLPQGVENDARNDKEV